MSIETVTEFFKWCTIIGLAFYIWTAIFVVFARAFIGSLHEKWFNISRESFNAIVYCYLGVFKLGLILFAITPYIALLVVG